MMFPTLVVSAFLAASTLVQASPAVPRGNYDVFISEFLAVLDKGGLTTLKSIYEDCFESDQCGPPIKKLLKSGVLTLLAPENKVRPLVLLAALFLSVHNFCASSCD
jgi:hypothetical protein